MHLTKHIIFAQYNLTNLVYNSLIKDNNKASYLNFN